MKKCFAFLLGLALCLPLFAAELTDAEMSGIYAGKIAVDINKVTATQSAAAAQSNIAAIVANDDIYKSDIINRNDANVTNAGDSAAAIQSNIAVAASFGLCSLGQGCEANVIGADINNTNNAEVENTYDANSDGFIGTTIVGSSVDVNVNGDGGSINDTWARYSAVANQSNIGIAAALLGDVKYSDVVNVNKATVVNKPE
ncbi:MAG: hypothetical protein JW867_03305 [Candidatus Omnitrophica bacterium]|nr:hypothetical protein [Candidatus Omnitrophota bacterium]